MHDDLLLLADLVFDVVCMMPPVDEVPIAVPSYVPGALYAASLACFAGMSEDHPDDPIKLPWLPSWLLAAGIFVVVLGVSIKNPIILFLGFFYLTPALRLYEGFLLGANLYRRPRGHHALVLLLAVAGLYVVARVTPPPALAIAKLTWAVLGAILTTYAFARRNPGPIGVTGNRRTLLRAATLGTLLAGLLYVPNADFVGRTVFQWSPPVGLAAGALVEQRWPPARSWADAFKEAILTDGRVKRPRKPGERRRPR